MLINRRNALMAEKRLPYDAEGEYLESTGTQWIDTGIVATNKTRHELVVTCTNQNFQYWLGVWLINYNSKSYCHCLDGGGSRFYLAFNSGNSATSSIYLTNGQTYVLSQSNGEFSIDGVIIRTISPTTFSTSPYTIYLFAQNRIGTPFPRGTSTIINECKIYDDGVLVRDFIPVRKGTVGAMYDKRGVGGMNPDGTARNDGLYFNRGTGDFVLGPDKN